MPRRSSIIALLGPLTIASAAIATSGIRNTWLGMYPESASYEGASCALCHGSTSSGNEYNAYGWLIKEGRDSGLSTMEAILAAEPVDSDADPTGASNLDEVLASAQPGWTPGPVNRIYDGDGGFTDGNEPPADVSGDLDPAAACDADVDGDGVVAVSDLLAVLASWGPCSGCAEDIDGDGIVAVGDLLAVLGAWGDCP